MWHGDQAVYRKEVSLPGYIIQILNEVDHGDEVALGATAYKCHVSLGLPSGPYVVLVQDVVIFLIHNEPPQEGAIRPWTAVTSTHEPLSKTTSWESCRSLIMRAHLLRIIYAAVLSSPWHPVEYVLNFK